MEKAWVGRGAVFAWLVLWVTGGLALAGLLLQWPDPAGVDGYFYLKNIQELSAFRGFYFRDYSLAFFFPAAINLVVGNPHAAWAIGVGLVLASFPFSLAVLVAPDRWPRRWAALGFLALFFCFQSYLLELGLGYFKNAFALAAAHASMAACAAAIARKEAGRSRSGAVALAAGFAVLAVLSHKTMLFWYPLLAVIFLSPRAGRGLVRKRKLIAVVGAATALAALALSVFYRRAFRQLGPALGWRRDPDGFWYWTLHRLDAEPTFVAAILCLTLAWLILAIKARENPRRFALSLLTYSFVLLLVLHPFQAPGNFGLHYRLWMILGTLPAFVLAEWFLTRGRWGRGLILAGLLGIGTWQLSDARENFLASFEPYSRLAADVKRIPEMVGEGDRLICRHGLEFYVDYVTNIRCRSLLDDHPVERTWRVAFTGQIPSKKAVAELRAKSRLPIGEVYLLIPERDWLAIRKRYQLPNTAANPMEKRPDFIDSQN